MSKEIKDINRKIIENLNSIDKNTEYSNFKIVSSNLQQVKNLINKLEEQLKIEVNAKLEEMCFFEEKISNKKQVKHIQHKAKTNIQKTKINKAKEEVQQISKNVQNKINQQNFKNQLAKELSILESSILEDDYELVLNDLKSNNSNEEKVPHYKWQRDNIQSKRNPVGFDQILGKIRRQK